MGKFSDGIKNGVIFRVKVSVRQFHRNAYNLTRKSFATYPVPFLLTLKRNHSLTESVTGQ